jgi:hypothetical protein
MLALTLLGVLVAADSSGGFTASIFTTGLPERVLQDLADTPHQAFSQVNLLTSFHIKNVFDCSLWDTFLKVGLQWGEGVTWPRSIY